MKNKLVFCISAIVALQLAWGAVAFPDTMRSFVNGAMGGFLKPFFALSNRDLPDTYMASLAPVNIDTFLKMAFNPATITQRINWKSASKMYQKVTKAVANLIEGSISGLSNVKFSALGVRPSASPASRKDNRNREDWNRGETKTSLSFGGGFGGGRSGDLFSGGTERYDNRSHHTGNERDNNPPSNKGFGTTEGQGSGIGNRGYSNGRASIPNGNIRGEERKEATWPPKDGFAEGENSVMPPVEQGGEKNDFKDLTPIDIVKQFNKFMNLAYKYFTFNYEMVTTNDKTPGGKAGESSVLTERISGDSKVTPPEPPPVTTPDTGNKSAGSGGGDTGNTPPSGRLLRK